jgi:MFS family permease
VVALQAFRREEIVKMDIANPRGGFLTLLKNRNFLLLWLAQLISMTIFNASNYALLVLIEEVTGSTTLIGVAIIAFSLPAVLFGAPAGVFVDRMNKRVVLWGSNCLRAIATFGFVISLLLNRHQLIPIYLITFLISTIGQFFAPAEGSTIPLLVSEEELMPALSLFNITFMLSQALGFILFAPLVLSLLPTFTIARIAIQPVEVLYAIVGMLYLVCAILITRIPATYFFARKRYTANAKALGILGNVWSEMRQGWNFVRRNNQLFLAVVQLSFAGVLILVISELATPLVTDLLLLPASRMAFIFAPAGIGLVTGSILMPRIILRLGKSRAILTGSIALAVAVLLLPLSTILARALQPHGWNTNPLLLFAIALFMFIAGVALDLINIPANTAMQELSPEWIKGRVLALQLMLYNLCSIPVILFIGAVADLFGLDHVLYLLSISIAAFGAWSLYYERKHPPQIPLEEAALDLNTAPEPDKIIQ